jgi:hypothetical protein
MSALEGTAFWVISLESRVTKIHRLLNVTSYKAGLTIFTEMKKILKQALMLNFREHNVLQETRNVIAHVNDTNIEKNAT